MPGSRRMLPSRTGTAVRGLALYRDQHRGGARGCADGRHSGGAARQ